MKHSIATIRQLDDGMVLAAERYDPRRRALAGHSVTVEDLARLSGKKIGPGEYGEEQCLVLGTGDAVEGVILPEDDPVSSQDIGSRKVVLQPGDVVVSRLRPYLRQIAYVDEGLFEAFSVDHCVASTEFYVLRGREQTEIACLVPFLLSEPVQEILIAAQEGGHHPRFNKKTLRSIGIPDRFLKDRNEIGEQIRNAVSKIRNGKSQIGSCINMCSRFLTAG